jgi:penicillin-binding protein 1A
MLVFFSKCIARLTFFFMTILIFVLLTFFMIQSEVQQVSFLNDYKPNMSSSLYDRNLCKIKELFWEKRSFVSIEKIPKKLIHAFLAAEDKHFFEHPGIDIIGMIRACFENTIKGSWKKRPVGASTITQQVAKNMVVGNKNSFERKLHEAITAIAMEYSFSKEHILELYLNEIFLGNKSYGVAAASMTYFNKPLSKLTTSECAYLASLPKAPGSFGSISYKKRILDRKNWVLKRMYEDGYILEEELKDGLNDSLDDISVHKPKKRDFDYFSEHVRRETLERFGEEHLYSNGLHIRTTQDMKLQMLCEKKLSQHLLNMDKTYGYRGPILELDLINENEIPLTTEEWEKSEIYKSLKSLKDDDIHPTWHMAIVLSISKKNVILVGTSNGKVLKIDKISSDWAKKKNKDGTFQSCGRPEIFSVGDIIYVEIKNNKAILQQIPEITGGTIILDSETGAILAMTGGYDPAFSHFNAATQAKRQPGSCFKPFVYMAALEQGYTGNSVIDDTPIEIYMGPHLGYYRPQNITRVSYGPTPLHVGLEQSRNQMTVNLAIKVGMKHISDIANRFGIYNHSIYEISGCLGSFETTLLNLTTAYGMICNHGKKITPHSVRLIQEANGKVIYEAPLDFCPINEENLQNNKRLSADFSTPPMFFDNREEISAYKVTEDISDFLSGVVQKGTAQGIKETCAKRGIQFCAKTGSTNECKDGWIIGFTKGLKNNFIIGVFIGYPTPRSMGEKATGSRTALPLMNELLKEIPDSYFKKRI